MNKAFVREPDTPPPQCSCGSRGLAVSSETLAAWLPGDEISRYPGGAFYCPVPGCPVAYFDGWGNETPARTLPPLTHPKNLRGPVCPCLGVTAAEVAEAARSGSKDLILRVIQRARNPEAECGRRSPDGRSCEAHVRRLFLESRTG